jgi:iron(III) transport system ATP-binding protein
MAVPRWLPSFGARRSIGVAFPSSLGFEAVSLHYGAVTAVENISLAIQPAEVIGLLGQSGCGKTSLLRLAAGIEQPTGGRILLDGREVSGLAFVPPEKRGIGLMFQDYALFPHMSVKQNVLFGLRGLSRAEAEAAALRALARVGLEAHADTPPGLLSGGEQQRVALARSVAPRPGILLMDEPFSNLDRRLRDTVREDTIAILRETGATTIIVTHDPEEAMRVADRIVLMHKGRVLQEGTPRDLYETPKTLFAARFFCDFNELEAIVHNSRVETPLGTFTAGHLAEGARALVAIRPQALTLRPSGCALTGRLIRRRFLGEVEVIEVVVQGLDKPLVGRIRSTLNASEGTDVGVEVSPTDVLVFAAGTD